MRSSRLALTCLVAALLALPAAALAAPLTYYITTQNTYGGDTSFQAWINGVPSDPPFASASSTGTGSATSSGSVDVTVGTTQALHLTAYHSGAYLMNNEDAYLAAYLTAPPGYVFQETGNQYLMSTASVTPPNWSTWVEDWNTSPRTQRTMYTATTTPAGGPAGGYPTGTEGIWATDAFWGGPAESLWADVDFTLISNPWTAIGTPLPVDPGNPDGLSTQLARTTSAMSNLNVAMNALGLRSGDPGHHMSEITTLDRAHIDSGGEYGVSANYRLAPSNNDRYGQPQNTAVKMTGYIYIDPSWIQDWDGNAGTPDDFVYAFSYGSNDSCSVKVGDTYIVNNNTTTTGAITNTVVPLKFTEGGYWPIEVQYFHDGSDADRGVVVGSAPGVWDSDLSMWTWPDFDTSAYKILGDPTGLDVQTNPLALDNPAGGFRSNSLMGSYYNFDAASSTPINAEFATVAGTYSYLSSRTPVGTVPLTISLDFPEGGGANSSGGNPFASQVSLPNDDQVAFWNGQIYAPSDGTYSFRIYSDDGSRVFVDGSLVVDCSGYHGITTAPSPATGSIALTAGWHDFFVNFFEDGGSSGIYLQWDPAGGTAYTVIPASAWRVQVPAVGANSVGDPSLAMASLPAVIDAGQQGFRVHEGKLNSAVDNPNGTMFNYTRMFAGGKPIIQGTDYTHYDSGVVQVSTTLDFVDPDDSTVRSGNFPGTDQAFPVDASGDDNYFMTHIGAAIYIPAAGNYAFSISSNNASSMRIGDSTLHSYTTADRDMPPVEGDANFAYAYFPSAGFYPMEVLHCETTGGAGLEIAHSVRSTPDGNLPNPWSNVSSLLVSSLDPSAIGMSTDWTGVAFVAEPKAALTQDGVHLMAQANVTLPALQDPSGPAGQPLSIAAEAWRVYRGSKGPITIDGEQYHQGLMATYYQYANGGVALPNGNTGFRVGERLEFTSGSFDYGSGNYAYSSTASGPYGGWGNLEDRIIAIWQGYISVPDGGGGTNLVSLAMKSDDNSWIYLDIDGDGVLETSPQAGQRTDYWGNLTLSAGLHKIMLISREGQGGEWTEFGWALGATTGDIGSDGDWNSLETTAEWAANGWSFVPSTAFYWDGVLWEDTPFLEGSDLVGDWANYQLLYTFPADWTTEYNLRLEVDFAGLQAIFEMYNLLFVPEPGTLVLFGAGLLALARRRRNRRK